MIRFFAAHPTIANLLMILFLAAGLVVSPTLLRETFPRKDLSEIEISVPYPGARPEEVETAICERIENALDGVTGLERHSCEARENLGRAEVKMREGDDFQTFINDVKTEIDAITDFPERAEAATVRALGAHRFCGLCRHYGARDAYRSERSCRTGPHPDAALGRYPQGRYPRLFDPRVSDRPAPR